MATAISPQDAWILIPYSDAVIEKEHAFVLETESLPEDILAPMGLMQDDTHSAS